MNKPYKEHNYYDSGSFQPKKSSQPAEDKNAHASQTESMDNPVAGERKDGITSTTGTTSIMGEELQQPIARDTRGTLASSHVSFFKKWGSLFVLGLALSIIIIDTTLLNVSLSTLITDLKTDLKSLQWVITAYSLTLAALTITGGRIGDLFGRKKMFMLGAIIFAIGSFIASMSTTVAMLIVGESVIEGVGAALMMPATASLLVSNFQGRDRGIAFGVWGGLAGASSAIGPILGGYLTKYYSWRWGFRINVGVTILLLLGSFLIKESRDTTHKPRIDYVGVVLCALGLLGIVYGVIQANEYGWLFAKVSPVLFGYLITLGGLSIVPFILILGLIFLVFFLLWEKHVEDRGNVPLVSLTLFKNRTFTAGVITTAIVSLGQVGLIFILPVFLQGVLKLDALSTGIALLPLSLALLIVAPLSGLLSNKISPKVIILFGLALDVAAMFILRSSISVSTSTLQLAPGLLLYGAGMGMVMAQISNLTLSAVSVQQAGEASGVNNTLRQVGSAFGSAILGAILVTVLTSTLTTNVTQSTIIPSQVKPFITSAVSKDTSSFEFGGGGQSAGALPKPVVDEITKIGKESTVEAARQSFIYAAGFAFVGFLAAFSLPNKRPTPKPGMATPTTGH